MDCPIVVRHLVVTMSLVSSMGIAAKEIRAQENLPPEISNASISYDREFAATPALVDHLAVDLGTLEPGFYHLTLRVTNLMTTSTIERSQRFRIVR